MRALRGLLLSAVPIVSLFLTLPRPAAADLWGLSADVSLTVGGLTSPADGYVFCNTGPGNSICALSGTAQGMLPQPVVRVGGELAADAGFGELQVDRSLWSGGSLAGGFDMAVSAGFNDTLTIGGFSGSGFVQYVLEGDPAGLAFFDAVGDPLSLNGEVLNWGPATSQLFGFTAGTPFGLSLGFSELTAYSAADDGIGCDAACGEEAATESVVDVLVYDSDMQPVTGYTVTSASGAPYPAVGAIPEPAAVWLLLTAIAACAIVAKKAAGRGRLP